VGGCVSRVRVLEPGGKVRWCGPERLGLSYRHSELAGAFVLACDLHLTPGDGAHLRARRLEITARKARVQPVDARSAGCTFRNPPGDSAGRLIDELGLKGLKIGGAAVSTVHGNFIVNEGGARPADMVALLDEVRRRVREQAGLDLQTEVRLIA
jgi:UDP-N-acetylmuramate dehydrogenase